MLETAVASFFNQGLLGIIVIILGYGYVKKDKDLQTEKLEHRKTIETGHLRELLSIKEQNAAMDESLKVLAKVTDMVESGKFTK